MILPLYAFLLIGLLYPKECNCRDIFTTSITWNVRAIDVRVNAAGGAPSVTVEKSTATGAFSAATVGTVTLGGGAYEGRTASSLGTVASGAKLRMNVGALGTATGWTIAVELGEP